MSQQNKFDEIALLELKIQNGLKDLSRTVSAHDAMRLTAEVEQYGKELAQLKYGNADVIGRKNDTGKRRFSLLPINCINAVLDVLEFGAKKYEVGNWQKVPEAETRYFDAALRHIFAWKQGEKVDPESGCHHLAHAVCCLIFLLWFDKQESK